MDSKPLRIAQVVGNMVGGGVEAVVMNYYRNIDRSKVQFDFIVYDTSTHVPQEEIEELGGRVFFIPNYKHFCAHQKALLKLFKENKYDIVHSHLNTLSVFSLKMAKKAGVKVRIAHSHSTSNKKEWKRNIIKNILRPFSKKYATHYFACSEMAGRWLFGDKTFERGEVTVINNAIDLDRFKFDGEKRNELRAELGLKENFVIGHIGRFMSQKNQTFLLDVFNEVQKTRTEARLLLLGDGPMYDEIKAKAEKLGLKDKVIFAGVQPNPEKYYQAMDCFVLPSLYEGLGIVLVEAQACGLPCIASTEVPEVADITGEVDFLSLNEKLNVWASHIMQLHINSDREQYSQNMRGTKYDIVSEAQRLLELYNNS